MCVCCDMTTSLMTYVRRNTFDVTTGVYARVQQRRGGIFLKVKQLVRKSIWTRKRVFSAFSCFLASIAGFWKRRNFSPEFILPIKPLMHICPCSRTVGISKKVWIQTYFGPVTVESEEIFRHFVFWRQGSRLATFFIASMNCIFWGASFEPMKNLATLDPEKLQGFHENTLYHCYNLVLLLLLYTGTDDPPRLICRDFFFLI